MNKLELIEEIKKKGILLEYGREYKKRELIDLLSPGYQSTETAQNSSKPVADLEADPSVLSVGEKEIEVAQKPLDKMDKLLGMVGTLVGKIDDIDSRVKKMEQPAGNEYRTDAKQEDIDHATEGKKNLDPKIVEIVENSLGTDFGIEVEPRGDQPGFLFTVIVPKRLSDNKEDERPKKDPVTGGYVKTAEDSVVMERYFPEDRRSKAIGSSQSYDAIREHCDRVRSYIVAYYQKLKKPLPEFRVKDFR